VEKETTAIQNNIKSYAQAYNDHDAKALANHWSENAEYINPETGYRIKGRAAIQKEFENLFQKLGESKLELTITGIEFQGNDRAIEKGLAKTIGTDNTSTSSEYIAIHVKKGGQWYIESVAESDHNDLLSSNEQLRELGWMIGKWIDKDDTVEIETECSWDLNHHFIKCDFKVAFKGKENFSGQQIIGWDPEKKRIRSWIFDSDGGYGEGIWSREDHKWVVHVSSILPDGRKASAVNVYTIIDTNNYKFHSSGREVSGQILPNIKEVSIIRTRAEQ
jgi:uncharacterized protein (TIGR02246 family)